MTGVGVAAGHFARCLKEATIPKKQNYPFSRSGGAHLICYGINDIGGNTAANQSLLRSCAADIMTCIISKFRAAAIYNAQGGANLAFGANWSNAGATAVDWTSGLAKQATAVDAAGTKTGTGTLTQGNNSTLNLGGTSTITFTIPIGYKGEPICFAFGTNNSASAITLTWGGTAATAGGTSGINATTTSLNNRSINANGIMVQRWTGPTNGLSSANAGQTITAKISTIAAGTCYFDGAWIESFKAAPVLVCNVPRLPQRTMTMSFGDGVTTGATTNFTSASAQFLSRTDASVSIVETDAQGAFTAGKTVSSVTNATTIVLSAAATGAFTNIRFTLDRKLDGYSSGLYWTTNTNFTTATVASHSAADADIANWNTTVVTNVVALFDGMVQIVDLDTAMYLGDSTGLPSNVYTAWDTDGGHPNEYGAQRCAQAVWAAAAALRPANDGQALGVLEAAASPIYGFGPDRKIIPSGQINIPNGAVVQISTNVYTAVAGDAFAIPFMVQDPTSFWTLVKAAQFNAGLSTVRCGWYDDVNGLGYPQHLRLDCGAVVMSGASVQTVGTINRPVHTGLNWLVFVVQAIGATTSSFATMCGPVQSIPGWDQTLPAAAAATKLPCAWKIPAGTITVPAALPNVFPGSPLATAVLAGVNGLASTLACPLFGVIHTIQ